MKRFGRTVLLLILLLVPGNAGYSSEQWKGMDMVRFCTGDAVVFDESVCRAYLQGVVDAHEYFKLQEKHPQAFCAPRDKAAREKGVKMISLWLNDFQERLEDKPIELATEFLHTIFPCGNPAGGK